MGDTMPDESDIHFSVIIPAFNEENRLPGTLRSVVDYLSRQPFRAEVLVVDDGSTDGTARVARNHSSGAVPVRLRAHPDRANHGKGAAVRLGMLEASGQYRLFMDADNSTSIDHVERFWPLFQQGFDVVIGSRNVDGARVAVHQPWYKELAGRAGNRLIQALAVPGIIDTQAGFKMFTQQSAKDLFPRMAIDRWGFDVEILAVARARGYKIREVPVTWINAAGSKVGFGSYFQVVTEVWKVRRNLKSGRYK